MEYKELERLASDNCAKNEVALTCGVDINNIPASSQEASLEILESAEGNNQISMLALAAQKENEDCREDDFASMLNNIAIAGKNEMLEYAIDAACDSSTKNKSYTDNAIGFVCNPKDTKSRKLCK